MPEPLVAIPISISPSELQQDLMAPASRARRETGAEPEPPTDHIIRSKVQPPVVRDSTLSRGRLLEWMDAHADERVRVLAAEAGFGKSTLLADWARRQTQDVRWLKLDPTDAEWSTFITYVVAAYREGGDQTFGKATLKLLAHVATLGTTMEQAVGQLLAELGRYVSEPSVLIIDDLQHVQANAEVRGVIERLVERAPAHMTFILSGRGKPELRLGRQAAQGNVVSLGTDDLRFTRDELNALFTDGYRLPLEGDLLAMVEERTEGWGASLQLLYSTLRDQTPAEIRTFIEGLRGSREPLYDFLAEEVLERQTPFMQRVLLHASILDRILTAFVVAAMTGPDSHPEEALVQKSLDQADELGLMSRSAQNSTSRRLHPLLREFLVGHLMMITPAEDFRQIHIRVATAAERVHWPTAAFHYIAADEGAAAVRVIGDSWIQVIGSGGWGIAMDFMDKAPHVRPSIRTVCIKARWLVAQGDPHGAIRILRATGSEGPMAGEDRALFRLALASALAKTEDSEGVDGVLDELMQDDATPPLIASLASAWHGMMHWRDPNQVVTAMLSLADECERQDLSLFAAIARHNASVYLLAQGDYGRANRYAREAIARFELATDTGGQVAASHMALAMSAFETGPVSDCFGHVEDALSCDRPDPDAVAEAAVLYLWTGKTDQARVAMARALAPGGRQGMTRGEVNVIAVAQAIELLGSGNFAAAWNLARPLLSSAVDPTDLSMIAVTAAASSALVLDQEGARQVVSEALRQVHQAGVRRTEPIVRFVDSLLQPDATRARTMLLPGGELSEGALLALADVLGSYLGAILPVPASIERSVRSWPERWRPVLRRVLASGDAASQLAAAELLSEVGEIDDVAVIASWERSLKKSARKTMLSIGLARRVCPTLCIADLGSVSVTIADQTVFLADVRPKAAALLLFLVTRPRHTATRDQVLDALWPEQASGQAANSLHQTLYFLRQSVTLAANQAKSLIEYIPLDAELLRLESAVVHIDSAAFSRQARILIGQDRRGPEAASLLRSYQGKFAPEFEYEDWAIQWREFVHAAFLELTEKTAREWLRHGLPSEAAALLSHAVEVDRDAFELRPLLLAALVKSGAKAAAQRLHKVYSLDSEREFGEPLPTLSQIVAQETL